MYKSLNELRDAVLITGRDWDYEPTDPSRGRISDLETIVYDLIEYLIEKEKQ